MITLLSGENDFEIRAIRRRSIELFTQAKGSDAITIVDGSTVDRNDLPQLLTGASLFATEQMIVIDDASAQKSTWDAIGDVLPGVDDETEVLLIAATADKRTRTYKWLQKQARITLTARPNESQLIAWLTNEGHSNGIDLTPDIARFIIEYTGGDQWQLAQDVNKLALSQKIVSRELIQDVLIANPAASAFDLLDAAIKRQPERVESLIAGVRAQEDPYRFFGLLSNQVFAMIVIAVAGNRPPDTIARDNGLHPYVVRKTQAIVRHLSADRSGQLARVIAVTDMRLKTSGADPWVLITAALKNIAA